MPTCAAVVAGALWCAPATAATTSSATLDEALKVRARAPHGRSRVIVQAQDAVCVDQLLASPDAIRGLRLTGLDAQVAEVPDDSLDDLARCASAVHLDRPVTAAMQHAAATIGARSVWDAAGLTGAGIGVAVIDSGVTSWHDDLTETTSSTAAQRVVHFADFVNYQTSPYDDYGHGTHVAGIIAGNGYDSDGARTGVAPQASLIALKVLDGSGSGYISNVIAAIDYAVANRRQYNIRVINLSVGAEVFESYHSDPLAQAARRAVDAGIVVVTAAGNLGRTAEGEPQHGGITSPGNAPWVLTVGAASGMGSVSRSDDVIAGFSSQGPTPFDWSAKPDLAAPGVGIESLADAGSLFYTTYAEQLLPGSVATATLPYLRLSGTSMAAPVVAGTIALMLQANPSLSPNAVKAILQYTADARPEYGFLTQGAGLLNTQGAVRLSLHFADPRAAASVALYDRIGGETVTWSRHIIWGNYRIGGGIITPDANAWRVGLTWGANSGGLVWGRVFGDGLVWGERAGEDRLLSDGRLDDNLLWRVEIDASAAAGPGTSDNVVWGGTCGGSNCHGVVWSGPTGGARDARVVWDGLWRE